jgi:hypothetical protein
MRGSRWIFSESSSYRLIKAGIQKEVRYDSFDLLGQALGFSLGPLQACEFRVGAAI